MASFPPPVMRPNLNLPIGPIEASFNLVKQGWSYYAVGMVVTYAVILAIEAVVFGIAFVAGIGKTMASPTSFFPASPALFLPFGFLMSVAIGVLITGLQLKALRQARTGVAPDFSLPDFKGKIGNVIGWYLLLSIVFGVISIPFYFVIFSNPPARTGDPFTAFSPLVSILSIPICIVSIAVQVGFLLAPLLIVDKGLTIKEAAVESWNYIRPNFFMWFIALLLNQIFASLGVVACCVGILFTGGMIFVFPAVAYTLTVQNGSTTGSPSPFREGPPSQNMTGL